ncbi:MAG: GNAT family N-acetyltransferase [Alphaproteobacteria bacterium]|nr:GNAT family N-acetyltransferase [Alphaproteobacteria bacterium]
MIRIVTEKQDEICRDILNGLPEWFGIPAVIERYAQDALKNTCLAYIQDNTAVGLCTIKTHTAIHTELALIAVRKDRQGQGVGTGLVKEAIAFLKQDNPQMKYLSVKTLDPDAGDPHYLKSYTFYKQTGFEDFEKFPGLWAPENPCLMMLQRV